ncbi:LolA-like protein [Helicovermis profundi]|uniref:Outer membrane lipoprotein carrier protein LolA n=1 Tax=Helicovermis profundi TaxID=3065157 RepID=A0AAU9E958_9FIRM|nr:hypothetical protein HLPR_01000 [Clostridia bacterium S502]
MKLKILCLVIATMLIFAGCAKKNTDKVEIKQNDSTVSTSENSVVKKENDSKENTKIELNNIPSSYSYKIKTTSNGSEMSFSYWKQDDSFRIEMKDPSTGDKMITILNGKEKAMYQYMPAQNMATKTTYNSESKGMTGLFDMSSLGLNQEILNESNGLKEIKYNGQDVYYLEVSSPSESNVISKMWISKKYSLPIKMENEIDGKLMYSTEITDINEGPFDAELFKIPDGVTVNSY